MESRLPVPSPLHQTTVLRTDRRTDGRNVAFVAWNGTPAVELHWAGSGRTLAKGDNEVNRLEISAYI